MTDEQNDLERRARNGEWLGVVAVATLFGVDRSTVDYWVAGGRIKFRRHGIRNRRYDPADVLRLLSESREVHGGDGETPSA